MSSANRRIFMTLAWLALLSVRLWAGFEFKGVAQMKRGAKAAHTFCASVKAGATFAEAQALAGNHLAKKNSIFQTMGCA